jgi:DNA-binding NarL/FixJ family response regulator
MSEKLARHKQPWKPDELQTLQRLANKGKGLKEIAKALNRTEESTKDAARQHGFPIAKLR